MRSPHGPTVGLASVYRVLDSLVEQGLLQRVDLGDGIARFEPVRTAATPSPPRLRRLRQGRDVRTTTLERAIEAVEEQSGYAIVSHDVVLHGACADCRP